MIEKIINGFHWIFAKTYQNSHPHEYIVRSKCGDVESFDLLCELIKKNGHIEYFFTSENIYLSVGDYTYWVIGNVINRRWNDIYILNEKNQISKVKNWKQILKKKLEVR